MAFPQHFLDELIARSDIVDIVSSYVALTRKGSNLFGLCPFHNEKTGSFTVFNDTNSYYCFGCGAGGEVISFIRNIENLDFTEAIKLLAPVMAKGFHEVALMRSPPVLHKKAHSSIKITEDLDLIIFYPSPFSLLKRHMHLVWRSLFVLPLP